MEQVKWNQCLKCLKKRFKGQTNVTKISFRFSEVWFDNNCQILYNPYNQHNPITTILQEGFMISSIWMFLLYYLL